MISLLLQCLGGWFLKNNSGLICVIFCVVWWFKLFTILTFAIVLLFGCWMLNDDDGGGGGLDSVCLNVLFDSFSDSLHIIHTHTHTTSDWQKKKAENFAEKKYSAKIICLKIVYKHYTPHTN